MKYHKNLLVKFLLIVVCALPPSSYAKSKQEGSDPRLAEWAKLPSPNIEKMKLFLGVWESRRESGGPAPSVTTFEIRDGVVRARHTVTPPGVEPFQLEVQFIRVLERRADNKKPAPNNIDEATVKALSQESDRARNRDEWQRPGEVMDALGVKPGHRVADIGSGYGYFTFRLAARVGAEGKVYAVDIDEEAINKVRQRKEREKLEQVEPILSVSADPRLPNDLDAVLIVDSYHEFREYDQTLQAVFRALKPGGRFVIIDGEGPSGRPRTEYHRLHTIPAELVREEVARHGFVFKGSRPGFHDAEYGKKFYFLIFEKPIPNQDLKFKLIASAF